MLSRIAPEEALKLMREEGYSYLDVRSVPEFEAGHPEGAFNIPLLHAEAFGMSPNPDFLAAVELKFARDAPLVLGCRSNGRSLQAARILTSAGYLKVTVQRCGFEGAGGEPGWRHRGLPVSTKALPEHAWEDLKGTGK